MLSDLLTREDCAKCRICCEFGDEDMWEVPVVSDELATKLEEKFPDMEFSIYDSNRIMGVVPESEPGLYLCRGLDREKGCILGELKPFDCRIWPFRIMEFGKKKVLTVSPVCPVVIKKPLDKICETAKRLAPVILLEAETHPMMIKKYIPGYPIVYTY